MNKKTSKFQKREFGSQFMYHVMMIPGMLFLIVFSFVPMFGIVMAFQDYVPAKGMMDSAFVGLKHFNICSACRIFQW